MIILQVHLVIQQANWTNWAPGQPDDGKDRRKNCVYVKGDVYDHKGQWGDEDCSAELGFICKIPASEYNLTISPFM